MADQLLETHRPSGQARRPIVVLLIDDQAFVGTAIGRLLATERDVDFHYCSHALDAVALANQIGPTVILQDLLMPEMDGLALVQSFRTNPQTAGTPVIVLSGHEDTDAHARALAHGATDYLVKPPSKEHLIACIRRHAAALDASDPDAARAVSDWRDAAPSRAEEQTLDRAAIEVYRQADPAGSSTFTRVLIDRFLDEGVSQVALLSEAVGRSDEDALKAIAHGLKGSAAMMGANKLAALCGQMERRVARHAIGRVVTILMAEIEEELGLVRDALIAEREGGRQS